MSRPQPLVVLGSRIFAEEVTDLVDDCPEYEVAAFGENWERARCAEPLLGRPVIWIDDLAPLAATHLAVCAIGTTHRVGFIEQAEKLGFRFATIRHPTARVSRTSMLGPGTIVSAGVMVAAHTRIDRDARDWRTAIRFVTHHHPGALHDAIEPLRRYGVNMTSLQSRPIPGRPWDYQFYADVEGHPLDMPVSAALREMHEAAAELAYLGCYPASPRE